MRTCGARHHSSSTAGCVSTHTTARAPVHGGAHVHPYPSLRGGACVDGAAHSTPVIAPVHISRSRPQQAVAAFIVRSWHSLQSPARCAIYPPRRAARARKKICWLTCALLMARPPTRRRWGFQPTRSLIACSNRTRERPSPGIRARADAALIFAALKCTRSPQAAGMFHLGDFYTRIGLLGWVPTQPDT